MVLGQLQRARRKVITRIRPYKALLGDATNQVYADNGYYWVRPLGKMDSNGNSTPGTAYQVRSGTALVVPRGGRQVWVGTGLDGHLTVLGFVHEDLVQTDVGIDPRSLQPNDPYRAWIRLKQIQNFRALPLATGSSESMQVQVRQLFYYTETGDLVRYNGTNADTHINLATYVPAADLQRYVVLWLRVYNPLALDDIQVTYSSTISSIDDALSFDELQECADQSDADTIPIQAFRLHDAQTTLVLDDLVDTDLRQFINMPQVYGFPNNVARHYRIHAAHSVVMPQVVTIAAGGAVEIQTDGVLTILSLDECECSGSGGAMSSFTVAGDSGTPQTITDGNTLTIAGGTGLSSVASATDTITVNLDNTAVTPGSYANPEITVDAQGRLTEVASGNISWKNAVRLTTTAALAANTYNNGSSGVGATLTANANGALSIDGTAVVANDRVLIKDESTAANNGIYIVTQTGSAGTPYILTRATDSDTGVEILGTVVFTYGGVSNLRFSYRVNSNAAPTVGVTSISFTRFDGANISLSNLSNTTVNADIVPASDGSVDLGISATKWREAFTNLLTLEERSAPSTPASGDFSLYSKVTGGAQLFMVNDGGVHKQVSESIAILWDAKTTGTNGGTSSSTTWNNRDLNTEHYDPDGIVSISSNKFTPIAGDYHCRAYSAALGGSAAAAAVRERLFNVTGAASVQEGENVFAGINAGVTAVVDCKFTANGTDEYRIDTYTSTGRASNGLGGLTSDGSAEIYTVVILRKVA